MIRRWLVEPDPEFGVVTENQLAVELAKCATIIDKMGGHLRVTTHRQRSNQIDGEAYTIGAMIEWVDRTDDVRLAAEQEVRPPAPAEPVAEEPPAVARVPETGRPIPAEERSADDEDRAAAAQAAFAAEPEGVIVDAEGQPEEDLTSIPAALR